MVKTEPELGAYWNGHCRSELMHDSGGPFRVLHQFGPAALSRDLFDRAAHVEVKRFGFVRVKEDAPARRDDLRLAAEHLNHQVGFARIRRADLDAAQVAADESFGAHHLGYGPAATEAAAEPSERGVGEACHRGQHGAVF